VHDNDDIRFPFSEVDLIIDQRVLGGVPLAAEIVKLGHPDGRARPSDILDPAGPISAGMIREFGGGSSEAENAEKRLGFIGGIRQFGRELEIGMIFESMVAFIHSAMKNKSRAG